MGIVGVAGDVAFGVGDAGDQVQAVVAVAGDITQGVGFGYRVAVAVAVVGVAGGCTVGGRFW